MRIHHTSHVRLTTADKLNKQFEVSIIWERFSNFYDAAVVFASGLNMIN